MLPIGWGGAPMDHWRGRVPSWHQVGSGGYKVASSGACVWNQVALPRPLAPLVLVCHHFGQNLPYLLYTNNSPSTSGTRWNLNIILHMWWWFFILLGGMLMVKTGVSDRQQRPRWKPHHAGWLANHHRAHSAATAGTVAPCHTLPWYGHKTMMTTMPKHALQDGVAYKLS
jgi:hypothetical protein